MRRSAHLEIPFIFPDYEEAYNAVGGNSNGYLYPQGFDFDEVNNLYINYAASSTTSVIVKYTATGEYVGYVILYSGSPEDIVVKRESGRLKVYSKSTAHVLGWADVTDAEWVGEFLNLTLIQSVQSVHLQMDYDNGMWIIEQRYASLGSSVSRTKFRVYNDDFEQVSDFYTQRSVVGFQLTTQPMYPYVPKTQGIALKDGHVFFGLGGSYIPAVDGVVSPAVSAIGLAELSLDGSVVNYGAISASKYLDLAKSKYSYAIRTEAEGLAKLNDGTLTQLVILSNRNVTDVNKHSGIIIEKLIQCDGFDYSPYKEAYAPQDLSKYTGVFPRGYDGGIYNPFSGLKITSVADVITFLKDAELSETSWYSSAVALTPLNGMSIPNGSLVTVKNTNNEHFVIDVSTSNAYREVYFYNGTSLSKINPSGGRIRIHDKTSSTQNTGRLVGLNINENDAEVSVLQYTSTEANNLVTIGGGSGSYGTCTRYRVQLGANVTEKTGDIVVEATTAGFFAGEQDKYVNGTAGRRWKETYSVKYMFNASVGQFYGLGSPEGVVTAGIGSTYQRTDGGANTSFYVKESGTGNTGWVAK